MPETASPILNAAHLTAGIEELKARMGPPPWAVPLVQTDRYVITVICQAPGHQNDWHYHLSDECWFIYEGELSWTEEGQPEPLYVRAGDWILAPANTYHLIEVHGETPTIRIATTYSGEYHRHDRADAPPDPRTRR